MAITFRSGGSGGGSTGAATCGMPSGATTGDLLIIVIEGNGEDTNDDAVPAGGDWTLIESIASATDGLADRTRCTVGWAWYNASLNLTVPDAGDHTIAKIWCFTGDIDPVTPIEAWTAGTNSSNSSSHTAVTGLTTLSANAMVVLGLTHGDNGVTISSPANAALVSVSDGTDHGDSSGNDGTCDILYGIKTVAGNAGTFTWGSGVSEENAWVALSIKPINPNVSKAASDTLASADTSTAMSGTATVSDAIGSGDAALGVGDSSTGWLVPDGDGTGTWSNTYANIDEPPGAENDSNHVSSVANSDSSMFYTLQDMPSDFDTAETVRLSVRSRVPGLATGEQVRLWAQVFAADESTPLTDEAEVEVYDEASAIWRTIVVHVTPVAGDATTWNGARLRLRADYTAAP